ESDSLWPDHQVWRGAGQCRQPAWRHEVLDLPADVGWMGRGGPRGFEDRAGIAQGARTGCEERKIRGDQYLGRSERIRARNQESNDVQVTPGQPCARRITESFD